MPRLMTKEDLKKVTKSWCAFWRNAIITKKPPAGDGWGGPASAAAPKGGGTEGKGSEEG
ncbi:hypothetical protein HMPREF0262_03000 [Clostridium sp. ATCC 29733]|nr:hypothetical protein HMPREF0262_03000 [Clostridium sp. ATCC 29733]